jgi:glutaredoxin
MLATTTLCMALSWTNLAAADVVTLRNGATFRGIVTADARATVSIQSDGALWSFHREQVARVELEAAGRLAERDRAALNAVVSPSPRRVTERAGSSHEERRSDVVVYGTSWCGYCQRAREYFTSHRIPFRDRDVEQDPQAREEVIRKCLAAGVPFEGGVPVLDVYGQIIHGFSVPFIERALQRHATD